MSSFNVSRFNGYSGYYQPQNGNTLNQPPSINNANDSDKPDNQPWYHQSNLLKTNTNTKKNYTGVLSFNMPKVIGDTSKNSVESASIRARGVSDNPTAGNNYNLFKGILA
jgi:hypothetical protein